MDSLQLSCRNTHLPLRRRIAVALARERRSEWQPPTKYWAGIQEAIRLRGLGRSAEAEQIEQHLKQSVPSFEATSREVNCIFEDYCKARPRPRLSNFVTLLILQHNLFGWAWLEGSDKRPDKKKYQTRADALGAAKKAVCTAYQWSELKIDDVPETDRSQKPCAPIVRGEKRRRAMGHGYSGGDGYVRLE